MQGHPDKETLVHPKIVDIKDQRTGKDKGKLSQEHGYRNTTKHLRKEKASRDEPHTTVSLPSVDCILHALVVLVLMLYGHHSTFPDNNVAIHNYQNVVKQ